MSIEEKVNKFFEEINDEIQTYDDFSTLTAATVIHLGVQASRYDFNTFEIKKLIKMLGNAFEDSFETFKKNRVLIEKGDEQQ